MGETFQAINPANEEVLALARKATKVDLAEAVKVARKVYARWSVCKINPHQRARYLLGSADLIEKHAAVAQSVLGRR